MNSRWLISKGQLLRCLYFLRIRYFLAILLAALGITILPSISRATISFDLGICNPSDGCNQSINFSPTTSGTTILDDTNPPNPFYQTSATSDGIVVLHGSGSTIDNANGGGFTLLILTPLPTPTGDLFGWTTIEFQADSLIGTQPIDTLGLTLTATDQFGTAFSSGSLAFPWEGNNGENQHYHVHASSGEIITQLRISYTDPLGGGNTIQDIHNIDVHSELVRVPEPSSFLLVGLSLIAMGRFVARFR
jgi:PEP-CTERM motif-containing protein